MRRTALMLAVVALVAGACGSSTATSTASAPGSGAVQTVPPTAATAPGGLKPIKSTVTFPIGVAVSPSDVTADASSALVLGHFNQITPENSTKPEAWYDADKKFRMGADTIAVLDFAKAHGLKVYGHTLLWHQQTPEWFFQRDDGTPLTSSDADKTILRDRLQAHINNVAKALSDRYGAFGSSTNPIIAFDVVNEVLTDGSESDGLRRSSWYNVLGEEYIEDAFNWAEKAFNVDHAAAGVTRPVKLAINDYNTDQSGKRQRMHDLVALLLSHKVPVDLVGHQFHVSLTTPVQFLEDALTAFKDLPVKQVVSEFDVMTGTPVDESKIVNQGYYYRDAFRIFRAHAADLFSVTVWNLYDTVSWHADNDPTLFDGDLKAKPAYFGAIDGQLPALPRVASALQADVPLDATATTGSEWKKAPATTFGDDSFQVRWAADHLSVYVAVKDATVDATDGLTFKVADKTYKFARGGTGDVTGVVAEVTGGWAAVVHIPVADAKVGGQIKFDVAVTKGATTTGWNDAGAVGTLTLVAPMAQVDIHQASAAPKIDGIEDSVWASASTVETGKQVEGTGPATAVVKTLWKGDTLYVLMLVTDAKLDDTASNPWEQDSVEIYVDNANAKAGAYRADDTQIRIGYKNATSFGTGDAAAQKARLTSATKVVPGGYVVEASITLLGAGAANASIGVDFQVNDAEAGARTGIRKWAESANQGYQSTTDWGVGKLLSE